MSGSVKRSEIKTCSSRLGAPSSAANFSSTPLWLMISLCVFASRSWIKGPFLGPADMCWAEMRLNAARIDCSRRCRRTKAAAVSATKSWSGGNREVGGADSRHGKITVSPQKAERRPGFPEPPLLARQNNTGPFFIPIPNGSFSISYGNPGDV